MFWRVAVPAVFGPLLVAAAARRQLLPEEATQMPESDHSFETVGPCAPVRIFRDSLLVERTTPAENGSCVLRLTITAPAEGCSSFSGPHPVVVFLNGFQVACTSAPLNPFRACCLEQHTFCSKYQETSQQAVSSG